MFYRFASFLVILLICDPLFGQNVDNGSFRFLEVPVYALQAGIGGRNISLNGKDVNLLVENPALVDEQLNKYLSLSYILFPGDIKISNITYLDEIGSTGSWGINLVYLNYGEMQGYDPTGFPTGEFHANEYALTINKAHQIGNYRLGSNLKLGHSGIGGYSATAIMFDLGGAFIHPEKDFSAALVIKNLGIVVSDYTEQSHTELPLNVQMGTSFKPSHMPLRFSFTLYDLTHWEGLTSKAEEEAGISEPKGVDQFFRHAIFGTEFLVGENIEFLLGYDHRKRKELKIADLFGSSGFSYGLIIGVKTFKFGFSRFGYLNGGVSNTFTLTSDLGRWIKKKSVLD